MYTGLYTYICILYIRDLNGYNNADTFRCTFTHTYVATYKHNNVTIQLIGKVN